MDLDLLGMVLDVWSWLLEPSEHSVVRLCSPIGDLSTWHWSDQTGLEYIPYKAAIQTRWLHPPSSWYFLSVLVPFRRSPACLVSFLPRSASPPSFGWGSWHDPCGVRAKILSGLGDASRRTVFLRNLTIRLLKSLSHTWKAWFSTFSTTPFAIVVKWRSNNLWLLCSVRRPVWWHKTLATNWCMVGIWMDTAIRTLLDTVADVFSCLCADAVFELCSPIMVIIGPLWNKTVLIRSKIALT